MEGGTKYHMYERNDFILPEDDFSGEIPVSKRVLIGGLGPACPGPAAGRMN